VVIWPAMLRRRGGGQQEAGYWPQLLLHSIDSSTTLELAFSTLRLPSEEQMQQLGALLAGSPAARLTYAWHHETERRADAQPYLQRPLELLLDHGGGLASRVASLEIGTSGEGRADRAGCGAPELLLPHVQQLPGLRELLVPFTKLPPASLPLLVQRLSGLRKLDVDMDAGSAFPITSSSGVGGAGRMQAVLDTLAALRRLTDLSLPFAPQGSEVRIPDWPHLTLLRARDLRLNDGHDPKRLSLHHCTTLRELALAQPVLPAGCSELAAVTRIVMVCGSEHASLPRLPALLELEVKADVSWDRLGQLMQGLPPLKVGLADACWVAGLLGCSAHSAGMQCSAKF
jgi:hypothetical protein